jgi:hypothetical protein
VPRHIFHQEIIYNELDDVEEVLFFEKGSYDLGYEINKKRIYKLRFKTDMVIGQFYCSFERKSMFICKASTDCYGFYIRKNHWK